jgi:ferritin-like metal-binding protein YciE
MSVKNLNELFVHTLKDVYYAERQLLKALPKMARKARSSPLRQLFEEHEAETREQIERLKQVFQLAGERAGGETCPAIEGILEEADELMDEIDDADTLDAAMIGAAQAAEHYEIARYGTLVAWAESLGMQEAVDVLRRTLAEEKDADAKLTRLAEDQLNERAR